MAEEQSIITAAEEALKAAEYEYLWRCGTHKTWGKGKKGVTVYGASGYALFEVPIAEVPEMVSHAQLTAELTKAREGASALANSLAASHAETAKAIAERDALAKEVETIKAQLVGTIPITQAHSAGWETVHAIQRRGMIVTETDFAAGMNERLGMKC